MSDGVREWRFYVDDMIVFAEKVLAYTAGVDQPAFVANSLVYDATLRNLELMGEAATHVPDDVRQAHPEVPWRMVIATRNRLVHAYLGIDNDALEHCRHRRHCALADAARGAVGSAMIRVHADPRGLAKAHAVQVARRVARSGTRPGCERKSLSHQRFPNPPPQYDIVLL